MIHKNLYIFRGLPGSGKSTEVRKLAKKLGVTTKICSADLFWYIKGEYCFNTELIGYAHQWCQSEAAYAMFHDTPNVIIDNCNITADDMFPYMKAAATFRYKIIVKESCAPWRNEPEECAKRSTHGVPLEVVQKMASKWQYVILSLSE